MLSLDAFNAMTPEQQAALLAQFQAKRQPTKLTLKVSAKGAVSVYGFGKWPVTLYRSQWERLIENIGEIETFIEANASLLAVKA